MSRSIPRFPSAFDNTLPVMRLTRAESGRGINRTVALPDGRRGSVFSEARLMNDPRLGSLFKSFDDMFDSATATLVGRNESGYHGNALDAEKLIYISKVQPPFRDLIASTQQERRDYLQATEKSLEWRRDAEPNFHMRSDLRQWLLSHSVADRLIILLKADYALTVSALEIGQAVIGLDDQQWSDWLDHARAVIHVHRAGTAADFPLKPSVEFMSAAGADMNSAIEAAQEKVKAFHERSDLLNSAEHYLQAVAKFISLVADTDVATILG